jgi:BirA family transcriptional regulator, biotin operon repressor / biotin---[acetyl-CoA-carboxylase] ligase
VTVTGREGVPADITRELALRSGRLGAFAARVVYLESTTSTNDVADRLAAGGAPHGTVVTADAQESGRGRMGRSWFSPPGSGLYTSVVLRPQQVGFGRRDEGAANVTAASAVSLAAGVAIAEGIRTATGLAVHIKWPNDLLVERRKLCGILAEASATAQSVQHVILGYGINVRPAAYPTDIADRATSLETELGRDVDRAAVLAETLACLAGRLSDGGAGFDAMLARWRELSPSSTGTKVEVVQERGGWVAGVTAGLDFDGALLVSVGGDVRRVIAGEVRWLP